MTKTILFLTKIFSYQAPGRTAKFEKFFRHLTDKNYHICVITPNEPGLEQYKNFLESNNKKIQLIPVSFPLYRLRKFFFSSDVANNKTLNFMINSQKRDISTEIIYKTLKLLKSKIFIYFILSLIPLSIALIILKYRKVSIKYISSISESLNIPAGYFIPFIVIVLFFLTIIFSSLLLKTVVNSLLLPEKRGDKSNVS